MEERESASKRQTQQEEAALIQPSIPEIPNVKSPKSKRSPPKEPNSLSIENFNVMESDRLVSSPTTLRACKVLGVLPKDLLYK